ncbi:Protein of unknown function [Cotesia congregata]|uniref:Uncharacterized protein n=1 Tax=Cotesia congregata TaxID=51543 RepID=A0A8J2E0U2_COTCN|nr:Protein of unknown function [Cotesia congregata]
MELQGNHTKDEKNWLYKGKKLETVKEFKYLGYWFSRSGNYKKHTKWTSGKAHQALNSTWGVIKRSGRAALSNRLYLYNTLANSGALYGVEVWGWSQNPEFNRLYAGAHKMALGVAKNTPDYLWQTEAGVPSSLYVTKRRATMYLVDILKMEHNRWPWLALKEECRSILNGKASKWGEALVQALDEMKCQDIPRLIWQEAEVEEVQQRLEEGLMIMRNK